MHIKLIKDIIMEAFLTIIPIILLVLVGVVFAKIKLFGQADGDVLNKFAFNAAFPALLFDSIFHTPLAEILDWRLIFGYLLVTYIIFIAIFLIFRYAYREQLPSATFAGMNASFSNSYFIALPILIAVFGIKAVVPVTVTAIAIMLFYIPVMTFLLEYNRENIKADETILFTAIKRTLTNPLVMAAIIGVLFSALHLNIPKPVFNALRYIGATAVALALITVGIELGHIHLSGKIGRVFLLAITDLFIKPALAFAVAWYLRMPPLLAITLIMASGVPTAKTIFIMSKNYRIYEQETASNILLTSIISVITIPVLLAVAMHTFPISKTTRQTVHHPLSVTLKPLTEQPSY
jgi:malonate transporter